MSGTVCVLNGKHVWNKKLFLFKEKDIFALATFWTRLKQIVHLKLSCIQDFVVTLKNDLLD